MRACRPTGVHRDPDAAAERVTSLVFGEPVGVVESQLEWTRILAPSQPTHLDAGGYPGWVRTADLAADEPLALARGLLGTPYVWGGLGHDGIDCSGLVHLCHRVLGARVPRDAQDQVAAAEPVADPVPGDLWFFDRPGQAVHHVGFVTEVGILHASEGAGVVEEPMSEERRATLAGSWRLPR